MGTRSSKPDIRQMTRAEYNIIKNNSEQLKALREQAAQQRFMLVVPPENSSFTYKCLSNIFGDPSIDIETYGEHSVHVSLPVKYKVFVF